MNKSILTSIVRVISGLALAYSSALSAENLSFDCDVPANHYSSVSQDFGRQPMIRGTLKVAELRAGNFLPVAGARLDSLDRTSGVSLQFVAANAHARLFDIVLNSKLGEDVKRYSLGQADLTSEVAFSLSIDPDGAVSVLIDGRAYSAGVMPMGAGKAMVFCSTGQFKFTDFALSNTSTNADPTAQYTAKSR